MSDWHAEAHKVAFVSVDCRMQLIFARRGMTGY